MSFQDAAAYRLVPPLAPLRWQYKPNICEIAHSNMGRQIWVFPSLFFDKKYLQKIVLVVYVLYIDRKVTNIDSSSWEFVVRSLVPGHRVPDIAPRGCSLPPCRGRQLSHPGEAGAGTEGWVEGSSAGGRGAVGTGRVEVQTRLDGAGAEAAHPLRAREAWRVRGGRVFDPRLGRDVHRGRALHAGSHFPNFLGFFPVRLLPRLWLPSAAAAHTHPYWM